MITIRTEIVQERFPATFIILQIIDQILQMFLSDRLLFTLFLIDEILDLLFIRITVEQETIGLQTVSSRTADLLIIGFNILRHVVVQDEPYVGLVDTNPKGDSRNDDMHMNFIERLLIISPL